VTPSARVRWTAYALAAALTLAALVWVDRRDSIDVVRPVARSAAAEGGRGDAGSTAASPTALSVAQPRIAAAPIADPFAVPDEAGGGAREAAAARAARAAPAPTPRPVAPALPFSYVGTWKEQGRSYVFLQRGGKSYRIEGPGRLDDDYAVQAVDERRVSLKYLPLGAVQELRLDVPPTEQRAAAVPAAPSGPSDPQPEN
jgi:hypothetical protein